MYRHNLKATDKKRYDEYLALQKERSKDYRQRVKMDPEKLKAQKEKARLRQRKFRENLKIKAANSELHPGSPNTTEKPNETPKARTRAETSNKRKQWAESKRKYRAKLSSQKKVWIRRKDRERKAKKNELKGSTDKGQTGYNSRKTLYNVTSNTRKSLPTTPQKFATVINSLIKNTTPRKRKAVEEIMEMTKKQKIDEDAENPMADTTHQTVTSNQEKEPETSMKSVFTSIKQEIPRKNLVTRIKQKYTKATPKIDIIAKRFYMRGDISTPLPQKRYANKHGPGYVMQTTLIAAYRMLRKEHPEIKMGFTKFTTLRPKNVRLLTHRHWIYCVCTICQNITYKLRALNSIRSMAGTTPKDFDELLNVVLCRKSDAQRFHDARCIFQSCDKCKDTQLIDHLRTNVEDTLVTWNHWEREVQDGKARKVLKSKREKLSNLLVELQCDVDEPVQGTSFGQHLFVGQWQQRQFAELKKNLPTDCALFTLDFGKNRTVRFQDEAKSAFFTARQITVHPIVVFYHSPDVPGLVVRNSLVFLSDDNIHDYHAVDHFFKKAVEYLEGEGLSFSKLIVFSDGCASQYKGKGSFADLSLSNIPIERNFFGSDHGKSECDGEVGCVNKAVDMAILGRKTVVSDANDMYTWCSTNLCLDEVGSKRRFFLVKVGDINRDRDETSVATLQGCRKLHHLANVPNSPYKLLVKRLSCYCVMCINGQTEDCPNKSYTGTVEPRMLKPTNALTLTSTSKSTRLKTTHASISKTTPVCKSVTTPASGSSDNLVSPSDSAPASKSPSTPVSMSKTAQASTSNSTSSSRRKSTPVSRSKSIPASTSKTIPTSTSKRATPVSRSKSTSASTSKTTPAASSSKSEIRPITSPVSRSITATTIQSSKQLWENLSTCENYDDLQHLIAQCQLEDLPQLPEVTFLTHKRTIDQSALCLLPEDHTTSGLYPCRVYGDGNCLPRCASLLVYGHEDNHLEMRARIIDELVRHEDNYLDDNFLINGCNSSAHRNVTVTFAMISEKYYAQKLSAVEVQRIFREEVLDLCRSGRYMGAWQMSALANVLKVDVVSVYPLYGGKTMRDDLHRRFPPFRVSVLEKTKEVYIMWSNINGANIPEIDWQPNHFVPLLKTVPEENHPSPDQSCINEVEELSPLFAFDDDIDEYNTSLINNIIQDLGNDHMPKIDDQATTTDGIHIHIDDQMPYVDNPANTRDDRMPHVDNPANTLDDQMPDVDNPANTRDDRMPDVDNPANTLDDQIPGSLLPTSTTGAMKYNTGIYIMVQHGQSSIPAVVDNWPWVKFFTRTKKKGFWTMNELRHTILETDVDTILPPPDITMCGTRLLYQFPEHKSM